MRRAVGRGVLLAVLLLTALAAPPASGQQAGGPGAARMSSTWLPYWNADVAYARIAANADLFHTVSPFWFRATSCTGIEAMAGAGSPGVIDGLHGHGIAVVPSITSTMTPAVAISCLGDPGSRAQHVQRVLEVVRSSSYEGIEFNYEHLALTTDAGTAARVRDAYNAFAADVCGALHAEGELCVHTVMPRTDDSSSVWRGKLTPAVYDYRHLGAVSDRIRVMGYDQHAGAFGPGPMAGWPWVSAVAAYTQATVPAGKGELGIPLYGRDWAAGSSTPSTLTAPAAQAIARQHGAAVHWDEGQRSPTFSYTSGATRHTVWFSDRRSVADRVALARAHGLGAAYWVPGQDDPATWGDVRAVAGARFWDVVGGDLQPPVEAVAARGIALGAGDGSFRPNAPVTRGQMASFLSRALALPPAAAPAPFSDTAGTTHAGAVDAVTQAGIATGFPDGRFQPDAAVTRGQMASFLQRGLALEGCLPAPFPDAAGSPHEPAVCAVAARGIAQGRPDGTFRPNEAVSRGQMARFLARALGL
jgi:spore germination protein YaaH